MEIWHGVTMTHNKEKYGYLAADLSHVLLFYRWRIGAAVAFLTLAKVAAVAVPLAASRKS
jgi:hypothetical protein